MVGYFEGFFIEKAEYKMELEFENKDKYVNMG